ncbi:Bug family tripartite tricarboxylate transporter substrate binding protein [Nitratireductor kimnyeongensis]|uniref:Bug family tripartite tricarboxylate transporter substrate binding protein n=1 Tax=Nitratireductor kimnyeongensis TaxID=430679 RepID=A0ABW0T6U5_9HYPH|nr:hypothetical protein [Nitratireductor kimnyeongensis]QZZ34367.1 hypothetical protein KW403_11115 [Nitratireductor kimnyeongensis]
MNNWRSILKRAGGVATTVALAALATSSFAQDDHYAGKTINMIVGGNAGGGFDTYARILANHMADHIPGNPEILVQNMPGAGSALAAEYVYASKNTDGTLIGAIYPGAIVAPLFDSSFNGRYKPTEFVYLGTANSANRVCGFMDTAAASSFEKAATEKVVLGGDAPGGSIYDYGRLLSNLTDAQIEVIPGYTGTRDIILAMERGELDGLCGISWSSLKNQARPLIEAGRLNVVVQIALEPGDELNEMGVPEVWNFVSEENEPVLRLVVNQQAFGRPYVLSPDTPPELAEVLRNAFDATMKDEDYLAEASKAQIEIAPGSGGYIQSLVEEMFAADEALVERARLAIAPPE